MDQIEPTLIPGTEGAELPSVTREKASHAAYRRAAIYGIEKAEGTRALVLELVEGPIPPAWLPARTGNKRRRGA